MALFRRFTVPLDCFIVVPFYPLTVFIAHTEIILRARISLFCSFTVPLHRFVVILCHALTLLIAHSEIILRVRMALFRSFTVPFDCLRIILLLITVPPSGKTSVRLVVFNKPVCCGKSPVQEGDFAFRISTAVCVIFILL